MTCFRFRSFQRSGFRGAVVVPVLTALLLFTGTARSGTPDSVWAQLDSAARARGAVRVIVRMTEPSAFDEPLSTPGALADRSVRVKALRDGLMDSLYSRGYSVGGLKPFRYIPYLAMSVDGAALPALKNDPRVAGIQEDKLHFPSLSQSAGIIGADKAFSKGFDGSGWSVAILDTGVDSSHGFLGGRVVSEACYSTTDPVNSATSICPGGAASSTAVGSGLPCDVNDPALSGAGCNHGTHVAGIAAGAGANFNGVARGANLIAIQVFSKITDSTICSPAPVPCISNFTSDLILALERVLALNSTFKIASVNMSLGGGGSTVPCDANDPATKAAVDNLRAVGIASAAAAGNSGRFNTIEEPACLSPVISTGSTDKTDVLSAFSDRASFLSIVAPGRSINSSVPGNLFTTFSGTSQATPHVAGSWALLKQAAESFGGSGSVDTLLNLVQSTGAVIDDTANSGLSFKRIQVDAAIEALQPVFSGAGNTEVVIPFWQADPATYTFMSISHPALSGMNSRIGVVMVARFDGSGIAATTEFTVNSGASQKVFITQAGGALSDPAVAFLRNSGAVVEALGGSAPASGNLFFKPKASQPLALLGTANSAGRGLGDITSLTFWGAVIVAGSSTGFAMEFIGDRQDSRTFNSNRFSGLN